eukprot:3769051-Karenia_brevis.AAC.1
MVEISQTSLKRKLEGQFSESLASAPTAKQQRAMAARERGLALRSVEGLWILQSMTALESRSVRPATIRDYQFRLE